MNSTNSRTSLEKDCIARGMSPTDVKRRTTRELELFLYPVDSTKSEISDMQFVSKKTPTFENSSSNSLHVSSHAETDYLKGFCRGGSKELERLLKTTYYKLAQSLIESIQLKERIVTSGFFDPDEIDYAKQSIKNDYMEKDKLIESMKKTYQDLQNYISQRKEYIAKLKIPSPTGVIETTKQLIENLQVKEDQLEILANELRTRFLLLEKGSTLTQEEKLP